MNDKLYLLKPAYKDYLWGGEILKDNYGKQTDIFPLAESWECSVHPDGPSIVCETGETLTDLIVAHPEYMGSHAAKVADSRFPILVKLIDAGQNLSIQVHPDDEYARIHENGSLGKTEMWYILEAEPDACIVYGFNQDVSADQVRNAVENNTIEQILNHVPIKRGDVFLIEPGTVHSIGKGCVVAEIQESSNLTYRLYDYNRTDAKGRKRELHIDKALDVLNLKNSSIPNQPMRVLRYRNGFASEILGRCRYFQVERILTNTDSVNNSVTLNTTDNSFHVLLCVDGRVELRSSSSEVKLGKGDCCFIPAGVRNVEISGKSQIIYIGC